MSVEGIQEEAQDTTLWGSGVGDGGWGCYSTHSNGLWSIAEKAVYPVDEKWRDVEMLEFPDHLVALNGVKSRTEVGKEKSGEVTWWFQVL